MILVNASNLVKGGGVQFAQEVVEHLNRLKINFHVLLRQDQLGTFDIVPNYKILLRKRTGLGRFLERNLLDYSSYNIVYTVFGPSYIYTIRGRHIMGFAQGWSINPGSEAYMMLSLPARLKKRLDAFSKLWLIYFEASSFFVETPLVKEKLAKYYPSSNIEVVYNTSRYNRASVYERIESFENFLYVANYYPHKNHDFLLKVAEHNKSKSFYITLDEEELRAMKKVLPKNVHNLGRLNKEELRQAYLNTDVCFIPSVLESFSAAFVEAMTFGRPIIAPEKDFVKDICGSSAFTYRTFEECVKIISNIEELWENSKESKYREYNSLLNKYGSSKDRAVRIVNRLNAYL